MKTRKKNGYYYAGHRVTDSELENIKKETDAAAQAAERIAQIRAMPVPEYLKHQSELNSLIIKKQNAEKWVDYILTHGKYYNPQKSQNNETKD